MKISPKARIDFKTLYGQRFHNRKTYGLMRRIRLTKAKIVLNPLKVLYIFSILKNEALKTIH